MKALLKWLVPLSSLLLHSAAAHAQANTTSFVCYFPIEPMPELVSGRGNAGIAAAIHQRVIYPVEALRTAVAGRVFVAFTVTPAGDVKDVTLLKSLYAPLDSAALHAVRQLPCFKPRLSKYGDLRYTVPIAFNLTSANYNNEPPLRRRQHAARRQVGPARNSTR